MHLAVAYDVSDDSNRRRVHRTLKKYGAWKQFSLFELEISKTDRVTLEDELESHIEPDDGDRVRIFRICEACLKDTTDLGAAPPDEQSNVL